MDVQQLRVLVVDDQEAERTALARLLGARGYEVDVASGGAQALELCRDRIYDLAIVDIFMPDMNGLELIRALQELEPEMAIVAISGNTGLTGSDCLEAAVVFGAVAALPKPLNLDSLVSHIESKRS